MKNTFLTIIIVITTYAGALAQGARSVLKFKFNDGSRIAVAIDSRYYDKEGKSITIGNLPEGRHYIKIFKFVPYRNESGGRAREVYKGGIRISSGTITQFTYDMRDGKLYANTEFLDANYRDEEDKDSYRNNRNDDRGRTDDVYYSNTWREQDMNDLKQRVNERITDGDKLKLMQSALKERSYTTAQMATMLGWLSFDDSKVTLAKWGYDYVSDKQNYWKLESEFTFSGSKEEFNSYINLKK